ncbi:uncharacterized protein LOC119268188 isoform X5 [Triticum dicoccoides]|uniref:uncharacterized protein LOC119268188 isoform X5 n=1 Tax=Triticum dicoccoides TaxID=85692 RepID=UPI0018901F5A|nr:uncharacterized protein LOC119268188 isoform X5 [Triticum dicoccoides]
MSPLPDNLRRAPNAASRHFLSGQHRGQLPRHRLLARFLKQRRLIQELLPSAAPPPLGASSTNQSSTKLRASSLSSPPSSVDYAISPQVHLYLKSNLHVGWCSSRIRVLICDMIGERDKFDDSSLSGK